LGNFWQPEYRIAVSKDTNYDNEIKSLMIHSRLVW
jgi:hypothetical protein